MPVKLKFDELINVKTRRQKDHLVHEDHEDVDQMACGYQKYNVVDPQ